VFRFKNNIMYDILSKNKFLELKSFFNSLKNIISFNGSTYKKPPIDDTEFENAFIEKLDNNTIIILKTIDEFRKSIINMNTGSNTMSDNEEEQYFIVLIHSDILQDPEYEDYKSEIANIGNLVKANLVIIQSTDLPAILSYRPVERFKIVLDDDYFIWLSKKEGDIGYTLPIRNLRFIRENLKNTTRKKLSELNIPKNTNIITNNNNTKKNVSSQSPASLNNVSPEINNVSSEISSFLEKNGSSIKPFMDIIRRLKQNGSNGSNGSNVSSEISSFLEKNGSSIKPFMDIIRRLKQNDSNGSNGSNGSNVSPEISSFLEKNGSSIKPFMDIIRRLKKNDSNVSPEISSFLEKNESSNKPFMDIIRRLKKNDSSA
jgi:hypothetical protein